MLLLSDKKLKNTVEAISENVDSWLHQHEIVTPYNALKRRKYMHGIKCLSKAIIGIFIKPKIKKIKKIYIFEGLRNNTYMSVFSPESVIVIGSSLEKKYASAHNYGFCWGFPIVSAISSKVSRGYNLPVIEQLKSWVAALSNADHITFFLYEDTQPLGTFFVYLSKLLPSSSKVVCIQHGYFPQKTYLRRIEGGISDINFVWDKKQGEIISPNSLLNFEIGLPYLAIARQSDKLYVVLVGTGLVDNKTGLYEKIINIYLAIQNKIANIPSIKIFYRPHPNEFSDKEISARLKNLFPLIDNLDKVQRLNGPRSIFIGTLSSLLYEAGIASHFVAHFKIHTNAIPDFDFDFDFNESETNQLVAWIIAIKKNPKPMKEALNYYSPLERFTTALHAAKLTN